MPTAYALLTEADHLIADSAQYTPEELEALITTWAGEGDTKLERFAAVFHAAEARMERNDRQREAYTRAIRQDERTMERMRALAAEILAMREQLGHAPKVPGVARLQANGGRVPLILADPLIPDAWRLPPAPPLPDAARIRAALDAGEEIPGAALGERGRSLRWE